MKTEIEEILTQITEEQVNKWTKNLVIVQFNI